jgi:lipopolysaccharide heptosyltransferase II
LLIGLDEPREGARALYDLIVPRATYHTHAVDWYLGVLARLGVPADWNFNWLPVRATVAATVKSKWRPEGARWIALQPGARWLNKRWPAGHFAELAREIGRDFPEVRFVILGGGDDEPLGEMISQAAPDRCLNLAGRTSLPEMVEWLRLCSLVVTNDTGPAHAAAALGKPTIALYGPTEPRRTGPYGQLPRVLRHPLPCVPCMKSRCSWPRPMECLTAITPALVAGRVRAELANP